MKILIIEDEASISRRIERLTLEIIKDRSVEISTVHTLPEGKAFLEQNNIDLLLLDLNLNGEDGFETLKYAVSNSFHTIVISAYAERAITAYEYGVIDFVPKPFEKDRLAKAFGRMFTLQPEPHNPLKYLAVKQNREIRLVPLQEVMYIQGAGIYSELHLKDGSKEINDKSLNNLGQLLPVTFERIHKSYIVDMTNATAIHASSGSKYELVLFNGITLPIGRTKIKDLRERWFN